MAESSDQDLARVQALWRDLDAKIAGRLPEDAVDVRFDDLALVATVSWTDEDGDRCETTLCRFETSRRHVQAGLLAIALANVMAPG